MVIGDVGCGANEEVSVAPAGGRQLRLERLRGTQPSCPAVLRRDRPALNAPPPLATAAVIGGFVVRDPGVPSLLGRYVFGDLEADADVRRARRGADAA